LPDREFYGRPEPALKTLTGQYRQALVTLLSLAGVPTAKAGPQADAALTVEKSLASAMASPGEKTLAADALTKTYSSLQLADLLKTLGAAPADVTIRQPDYFKAVDKLLAKPVVAQWQAYLRVRLMLSLADALPEDPRRAYLSTLGRAPAAAMPERLSAWIRDEGADLLDLAYADAFLGSDRQQQAQAIGEAVRAAMARAIDRATWLSADGKAAAISKLSAMRLGIGQPVVPTSPEGLVMDRDNLAANLLAVRRWNRARSLTRLQAPIWPWPVDQTRPVIGYQGANNRLIVTAAALQIPVFNGESQAADFGALGSLIGQQMSLAFADLDGIDGLELGKREAGLLTQYAAYPVTPSVKVDAQRTQRMNAADLSGIELSWDAYRNHAGNDHGGDQAFFRAWASLWARQDSESALAAASATSVFAPSRWRVNGPLANLPAFAQTYGCQAGPVAIWR
jgi:putative endopeptidase